MQNSEGSNPVWRAPSLTRADQEKRHIDAFPYCPGYGERQTQDNATTPVSASTAIFARVAVDAELSVETIIGLLQLIPLSSLHVR